MLPHSTRSELPSKGSPVAVRQPDTPDDPDRDATVADLRPGNVLVLLITAYRRNDYRSAMRCRKHLRRCGLSVTLGRLDPYVQAGELGFQLDLLVRAIADGDFKLATAHRRGLGRAGVNIVPVPLAAKAGRTAR